MSGARGIYSHDGVYILHGVSYRSREEAEAELRRRQGVRRAA